MDSDNTIIIIAATALVGMLAVFIILFVILYKRAQVRFELEREQYKQALLQAEIEIREQTLADIARDLHDNFGQIASLIKINLNMLSEKQEAKDKKHIEESIALLTQLIDDMRALPASLNGKGIKEVGLVRMMEKDVARINTYGSTHFTFKAAPGIDLEHAISIFIYRMFQEIVNNILKHSQASEATISIEVEDNTLTLQVEDNGIGIPEEKRKKGNGLSNIKERCKIIGAHCSFESIPGKGTCIKIAAPIRSDYEPN